MRTLPLFFPLLFLAACGGGGGGERVIVRPADPRLVSILVEVYDPVTNYVWEGVSVRVVESDQEWSGCTCSSPYEDWYLTGADGRVLIDEFALGYAEVGFQVDVDGRALLLPNRDQDQATVVLEIDAVGFMPKIVEVPLSWNQPDVFVEVPFN